MTQNQNANRKAKKSPPAPAAKPPRGLGSGLSKLLGDDFSDTAAIAATENSSPHSQPPNSTSAERLISLPIGHIYAAAEQPRREFSEAELDELAHSLLQTGVLQPIIAVEDTPGHYRIVAGERRWRAAQRAGLHEVPAIIKTLSEAQILQVSLIENIQRQDLNALEEARAYRRLVDECGYRQEDIAALVGKSRSYVANIMRLLQLPESVQEFLRRGALSVGHVRSLVGHPRCEALAAEMIARDLSVRQAEDLIKSGTETPPRNKHKAEETQALQHVRQELERLFGFRTIIKTKGKGYVISLHVGDTGQLHDFILDLRQR